MTENCLHILPEVKSGAAAIEERRWRDGGYLGVLGRARESLAGMWGAEESSLIECGSGHHLVFPTQVLHVAPEGAPAGLDATPLGSHPVHVEVGPVDDEENKKNEESGSHEGS
jgi:hypothetical protein